MSHKFAPAAKAKTSPPTKGSAAPVAPPKTPAAAKAKVNPTITASGGPSIGRAGATPRHAPLPRHSPKTARGN